MRLYRQDYHDIERIIEFDFVRATEAAALNSLPWLGRGEKEKADAAACDALRGMFDLMNICGEVVIGEGIKDDAPGIFKGEQLGTWLPGSPQFDIAIDPIDGTTNISKGAPNSISCIAAASPEEGVKAALRDVPSFYMHKLAYGPRVIAYTQKRGDSLHLYRDALPRASASSFGSRGMISARRRMMLSGLMPSASALKLVMMRCRSTGMATLRMSSQET